jgi:hypothetical protein
MRKANETVRQSKNARGRSTRRGQQFHRDDRRESNAQRIEEEVETLG